MKIGEYLFTRLRQQGVGHVFGIPGDFALPLYGALDSSGLAPIVVTHEPGAGFAADAYARLRGLGVALVTFGAGGLNMVNAIAQAYAERSPVLVVSGAPEIRGRRVDVLLHHRVKTFESQHDVYREITGASAALDDPATAVAEIDRVLDVVLRTKRPGYLEVPRDVVGLEAVRPHRTRAAAPSRDRGALEEAMAEVVGRLRASRRPMIYAGVEVQRFALRDKLIALVERLNLPIATSLEGKTVFPENHPNFVGIYMGRIGSEAARRAVEGSDCLLMLGAFLTDVNTGFFTAEIDRARLISATSDEVTISHHRYPDVTLPDLIEHLLATPGLRRWPLRRPRRPSDRSRRSAGGRLTTGDVVEELNRFVRPKEDLVVADVGDCLYACAMLRTEHFLAPGYYNSMGFGVPAATAAQLAVPGRRPIALVGDGGFRMTGTELATARRYGLNPIVILFDNGSYATLRAIAGEKPYFALGDWDYVRFAEALGGRAARAETRDELRRALAEARRSRQFFLVDAVLDPTDLSPTWQRLADLVRSRMRARRP